MARLLGFIWIPCAQLPAITRHNLNQQFKLLVLPSLPWPADFTKKGPAQPTVNEDTYTNTSATTDCNERGMDMNHWDPSGAWSFEQPHLGGRSVCYPQRPQLCPHLAGLVPQPSDQPAICVLLTPTTQQGTPHANTDMLATDSTARVYEWLFEVRRNGAYK